MKRQSSIEYFSTRRADGSEVKTPRLLRKKEETPDDFFKRMNQRGYGNGNLEKVTAHWNSDHSEYHAGSASSCRFCKRSVKEENGATNKSMNPVKIGSPRRGKKGLTTVALVLPAAFAEQLLQSSLSAIHVSVDVAREKVAIKSASGDIKSAADAKQVTVSPSAVVPSTEGVKPVATRESQSLKPPVPLAKSEVASAKQSSKGLVKAEEVSKVGSH